MDSLGPYTILGELGRGAMGVVFRARRAGLDRDVALKVLPIGSTEELAARFRREAQLAARIHHPNVVGVHDVGEADGRLYLAMDLIAGVALDAFLEEGRYTALDAARLLVKLADAVGSAHREGVLHRDIKPGNILLDAEQAPFLADFGLARAIDTAGSEKLSRSGSVLGTPAYMSPEQAQGADIDGRTDVWALGAVGYEMVSNLTPFRGESAMQMLAQVCSHDPPPLRKVAPDVPRDFEAIIHRCLEKQRDKRYRTAADLVDDLQRFLDGQPVTARRVTLARRGAAWVRRNRALAATALVGCLGIGGIAGYAFVLQPRWKAAARVQFLANVEATARVGAASEAQRLAQDLGALQALPRRPVAVDEAAAPEPEPEALIEARRRHAEQVAAIELEARPEGVADRIRSGLPPGLRPAANDTEANDAFERGVAAFNAAPLQARAALLRGEPALAYRLDPTGDVGLRAAVEVANALFQERRLAPAASLLRRLRSRYPDRPVAQEAVALLTAVLVEAGDWDQALAAALDAGDAARLPPRTLELLQRLGAEQQHIPLTPRGKVPFHYLRRAEPLRVAPLTDGRRLLLVPQRPGLPTFVVAKDGTLVAAASPQSVLPPGTRVVDLAAGDVDGDGTVDLFCAVVRPGSGSGAMVVTPDGDGWRLLASDIAPGSPPAHLIAGDMDADGRLEALICFHWDSEAQWLVHWDPATRALVHRTFIPPSSRPWIRGGGVADLDGDGTPELIVGTSLHTSGEGLLYRYRDDGAPILLSRFDVWEPGEMTAVTDPAHPTRRLLLCTSEVGLQDLNRSHVKRAGLPANDGLMFLRWDGTVLTHVRRHEISLGDPDTTWLGNISHGTMLGQPAIALWADRTRPDGQRKTPEGRRLRIILGDPLSEPLTIAPPRRVEAFELLDCDGDGESELIGLTTHALYVRGPRRDAPPALHLESGEAPTDNEALQRLRAARDLAASNASAAAEQLLSEVVERFAGSPEAAEADRLRVDARIQGARAALTAAEYAVGRGEPDAEATWEAARGDLAAVADAARATADRYRSDPAKRRRFLLQAADAAESALDWTSACACLDSVLEASRGVDDSRTLEPRRDGLRTIERLFSDRDPPVALGDPEAPLIATMPGRIERLADGGWRIGLDSHCRHGVFGIPVTWRGTAMRGRCTIELDGSAWAAGLRVGLVSRRGERRGGTYVWTWMHGVTQWDDQGVALQLEGGAPGYSPGTYSGKWEFTWAFLPEAGLVTYDVRDAASGVLVHRRRGTAPHPRPSGDYVVGVLFASQMGDSYLSHALHPSQTQIVVRDLQIWGAGPDLQIDRGEPDDAVEAVEAGGGWLVRNRLDEARPRLRRALARDPGSVRGHLLLAIAELRHGSEAEAATLTAHALGRWPYEAITILEDMGRPSPAAWRRDIGRCCALALERFGDAADVDTLLARAAAHSLRGDLEVAYELLMQAARAGRDDTALHYLRRRNMTGPAEQVNGDWRWLDAHNALLPGTELPVVCWSPGLGESAATVRSALAGAWRTTRTTPTLSHVVQCWVAVCRHLTLAPDDPEGLLLRAQLGLMIQKHGVAERDLKQRARVLHGDPAAALLVADLYAARRGTRDTLWWIEEAVRRGLRWTDLDATARSRFEFLEQHPGFQAAKLQAGSK